MKCKAIFLACSLLLSNGVRADDSRSEWVLPQKSYDKRLPPVIPGEEVEDMHKNTSKVWSMSGPVPVDDEPQARHRQRGTGDIDVVVDGREFLPKKNRDDRDFDRGEKR